MNSLSTRIVLMVLRFASARFVARDRFGSNKAWSNGIGETSTIVMRRYMQNVPKREWLNSFRLFVDSMPRVMEPPDDTGARRRVEDYRVFVKRFATAASFPWRNAKCIPLLCKPRLQQRVRAAIARTRGNENTECIRWGETQWNWFMLRAPMKSSRVRRATMNSAKFATDTDHR